MRKLYVVLLLVFSALVVAFALLSNRVGFHDTFEYITVAKELAGIHNVNVHSGHSLVYPAYLSVFLRAAPTMGAIKFVNVLWLIGIAALILLGTRNPIKPFLLFASSPMVWWLSPQVTPVLPAAFLFTLAYLAFKTYEASKKLRWIILTNAALGLSLALYEPMILLVILFILFFFYNKQMKFVLASLAVIFAGLLPRFALDYYLFHNPFYSVIRYVGANASLSLATANQYIPIRTIIPAVILVITPILFLSYRINWRKYWREGAMLSILFAFFILRTGHWLGIKYFLLFAPIVFLLLGKSISRKQLLAGVAVSLILILVIPYGLTWDMQPKPKDPYALSWGFGTTHDLLVSEDLQEIRSEGYKKLVVLGAGTGYAAFLFSDVPFFYWWKEYRAAETNQSAYSKLDYVLINPKIGLLEQLELRATLNTKTNDFTGVKFMAEKSEAVLPSFEMEKCYRILCIYNKT